MSELAPVQVVVPLPLIDYGHPGGKLFACRHLPRSHDDDGLPVHHPRWVYPPFGGVLNPACLALAMIPVLTRLRKSFAFDLIDAHWGHPAGIAAAMVSRALGCPFTVTLRGNEMVLGARGPIRAAMRRALQRAGRVISVSESLRRFALGMGVDEARAVTIPNGIDSAVFYPRDRGAVRQSLGLSEQTSMVLSAGTLSEGKGHHRTARALRAISRDGFSPVLVIAGANGRDGPYEKEIRQEVARLGLERQVRFTGQVPPERLAELMSAADVFCLASRREGWPNAVHEAMACGTPVVATAVGAIPEMVLEGVRGYVVPFGEEAALAAALEKALRRPWDRAEICAWAHARSWRQVGREVVEQMAAVVAEATGVRTG
jgi:glycosyltransferase involved in cell wall biosynthesis